MRPLFLLLSFCFPTLLSAAERPNVLLIISDDQAWGDYGFMGHEHIETPHLDKLASVSLVYTRGYVAAPLCRPSLASIFSGRYVHQHGITGNDPRIPDGLPRGRGKPESARFHDTLMDRIDDDPGLAHLLGKAGYLTLQTGKWWEGDPTERGGFTHGMTHGDPKRGGRHGDEGLRISREGIKPIADFITEARDKKKPFFIWHAPFLPHTPHNPPARLFNKYRTRTASPHLARYWAMCDWFDETCGELLRHLDKQGLGGNTLILYVTDNGWIQSPDSRRYAPRSKRSPYEGGVRTPIMVHWPGRVAQKFDEQTLVSAIDLAPTILKACGVEVPGSMSGLDLRDRASLAKRKAVFGAAYHHDVHDVDKPNQSLQTRYVISGGWKLLVPNKATVPEGRTELYQVTEDPSEETNLADRNPDKVRELTARLDAWWPGAGSN